jgi:hypothetical protein
MNIRFNPCAGGRLLLQERLVTARGALGGEVLVLSPADSILNQFSCQARQVRWTGPMNFVNLNRREILEENLAARNSTNLNERTLTAPSR